ncbi:MAG: hypothetical protein M1828_005145 [Chrysothrix sp. TS-e1954]|nr:MAG: hypothetical protein M1828_005145 [Chrysothrix sp. TS-e1954]
MARELRTRVPLPPKDAQEHVVTPRRLQRTESKDSTDTPSKQSERETRMSARRKQILPATIYVASTSPLLIIKGISRDQFPISTRNHVESVMEDKTPTKRRKSNRNVFENVSSSKRRKLSPANGLQNGQDTEENPIRSEDYFDQTKCSDHTAFTDADTNWPITLGTPGDSPASRAQSKRPSPSRVNTTLLNNVQPLSKHSPINASPMVSLPVSPRPPVDTSTPLKDPDDLDDSSLPPPFLPRQPAPSSFQDKAAKLLFERYDPIALPNAFLKPISSHNPSTRSTETLQKLAQNTFRALVAWQNEYLQLDQKTAPRGNPVKKPATGGRIPMDADIWEQTKEIELWGHVLGIDGMTYKETEKKKPLPNNDAQNVMGQVEGRRPRRRGADASLIDSLAISEDDAGASKEKRSRKPVRRFDAGSNGLNERKRRPGEDSGVEQLGPRKRGRVAKVRINDQRLRGTESPQPDGRSLDNTASPSAQVDGTIDHLANEHPLNATAQTIMSPNAARRRPRGLPVLDHGPVLKSESSGTPTHAFQGALSTDSPASGENGKQRIKSDKRSESMTAWWAKRKKKQAEQRATEMREKGLSVFDGMGSSLPKSISRTSAISHNAGEHSTRKITEGPGVLSTHTV